MKFDISAMERPLQHILILVCVSVACLVLLACAAPTSEDDAEEDPLEDLRVGEEVNRICFTSGINGFSSWDGPNGLLLRRGVNDRFLVLVDGGCFNTENALRVGIDERFGSGCLTRGDRLFVSDRLFPDRGDPFAVQSCRVLAIYDWDEDAVDNAAAEGDADVE